MHLIEQKQIIQYNTSSVLSSLFMDANIVSKQFSNSMRFVKSTKSNYQHRSLPLFIIYMLILFISRFQCFFPLEIIVLTTNELIVECSTVLHISTNEYENGISFSQKCKQFNVLMLISFAFDCVRKKCCSIFISSHSVWLIFTLKIRWTRFSWKHSISSTYYLYSTLDIYHFSEQLKWFSFILGK